MGQTPHLDGMATRRPMMASQHYNIDTLRKMRAPMNQRVYISQDGFFANYKCCDLQIREYDDNMLEIAGFWFEAQEMATALKKFKGKIVMPIKKVDDNTALVNGVEQVYIEKGEPDWQESDSIAHYELDLSRFAWLCDAAHKPSSFNERLQFVRFEDGHAVATDSIRLHVEDTAFDVKSPFYIRADVLKMFAKERVCIMQNAESTTVKGDKLSITLDSPSDFPEWEKVMPTPNAEHQIKMRNAELLTALKEISPFVENGGCVIVDSALRCIRSKSGVKKFLTMESGEKACIEFGINLEYLKQAVSAVDGESVYITTQDTTRDPLLINGDSLARRAVVMPMAL